VRALELYVHIPFCVQKCKYCDFLSGNYDVKLRERYTYALINDDLDEASETLRSIVLAEKHRTTRCLPAVGP
jgi:oxygen-independent coproporphyrinogen-3 oxidase